MYQANQAGTSGIGLMATKTLVVMGDPQVTTTAEHPRSAMRRGYDKATGNQVGAMDMPAPESGSPMNLPRRRQAVHRGGDQRGNYSGEYLALALPR